MDLTESKSVSIEKEIVLDRDIGQLPTRDCPAVVLIARRSKRIEIQLMVRLSAESRSKLLQP
jgi:hypothetical protein